MTHPTHSMHYQLPQWFALVLAYTVLGIYMLALFCPALPADEIGIGGTPAQDPKPCTGWDALLLGWAWERSIWAWSANLFLVAALLCLQKKRFGWACSSAYMGTALAATSWFVGRPLLIGYYLWQASFIVLAVGAHWACLQCRRKEDPNDPQNRLDVPPPLLNGLQESSRVP